MAEQQYYIDWRHEARIEKLRLTGGVTAAL